jgi:hypothetical protein
MNLAFINKNEDRYLTSNQERFQVKVACKKGSTTIMAQALLPKLLVFPAFDHTLIISNGFVMPTD